MRNEVAWNVYQLSFLKFDVIVSKQFCPFNDFFNVTQYREVIVKKKITPSSLGMEECRFEFDSSNGFIFEIIDSLMESMQGTLTWPGVTVKSYFCS